MISVTTPKLVLLLLAADEDRGPLQRREYHPGAVMLMVMLIRLKLFLCVVMLVFVRLNSRYKRKNIIAEQIII